MAKSFSDFSQLKSLKKDLPEKAPETSSAPVQNRRVRTITLKTPPEHKAAVEGMSKGQAIRMVDSNDEGFIVGFTKEGTKIELEDGLVIIAQKNEFYIVNREEDLLLRRSVSEGTKKSKQQSKKISQPQDEVMEVDLHLERIPGWENVASWAALDYQIDYFKRIIRQNLRFHGKKIVFIHGVGDGKLKDAVRRELDETFVLSCSYTVGQWQNYGMGATTVTIK